MGNQNFNDKYRSKMAKDKIKMAETHKSQTPYLEAATKHLALNTFAPDLVKWTKKDINKLLAGSKKED